MESTTCTYIVNCINTSPLPPVIIYKRSNLRLRAALAAATTSVTSEGKK